MSRSRVDVAILAAEDTNNPIFASSQLLRGLSLKWDELLNLAENEGSGNGCTIYIPQISQHVMENVIRYINVTFMDPNPQPIPICDENVQQYFSAGQFLQLKEIQTFCLDHLKSRESTLENISFLFSLMGTFDDSLVSRKIGDFFLQNAHQLDFVVRKCKSHGISESTLTISLVDWLNSRDDLNPIPMELNLAELIQELSNTENQVQILEIFHQNPDSRWRNLAFEILVDIAKSKSQTEPQAEPEPMDLPAEVSSAPQGIIYFLLGTRQMPLGLHFWSFDIKARDFRFAAILPEVLNGRRRLAMLHHNGDIYFMGGENCELGKLTDEVHVFNLQDQQWRLMHMIKRRFDFKAVVLNNYIYVVGGCLEDPKGPEYLEMCTNSVEKLSLDAPFSLWERDARMINFRSDAGILVLNGKIYAIGGCVSEEKEEKGSASNLCECFSPSPSPSNSTSKGQWSSIAPMNYKRLGLSAVATGDRIFALGGAETFDESDVGLRTVEIYDPTTNSWTLGPSMNHPRKFFSAVFFENCIYAISGDDVLNEPTMEKFDLETQEWTVECNVKADGNFLTVAFG